MVAKSEPRPLAAGGVRYDRRRNTADRRVVHRVCNQLVGRLVAWRELLSEEPELLARLEAIGAQAREVLTSRRQCLRGRGRCGSHGKHTKEDR
jgi:hypothetical protein